MNEELLRKVIAEVIAEVAGGGQAAGAAAPSEPVSCVKITEIGKATKGTDPREVVFAVTP